MNDSVQVELAMGSSSGGAWDDRELIRAYDAAIDEFHVHHPGPGSWLDKATAALAKGRPLPGAPTHDTAWYSASLEEAETPSDHAKPPYAMNTRPKRARPNGSIKPTELVPGYSNPYQVGMSVAGPSKPRPESPSYAPPSPTEEVDPEIGSLRGEAAVAGLGVARGSSSGDGESVALDEEAYDPIVESEYTQHLQVPRRGSGPVDNGDGDWTTANGATNVSIDQALSNAMSAQYWAGYWMGVAQGSMRPAAPAQTSLASNDTRPPFPGNVVRTRQQFGQPPRQRLRR